MKIFWQLMAAGKYVYITDKFSVYDVRIHPTKEAAERVIPDFLDRIKFRGERYPLLQVDMDSVEVKVLDLKLVEESAE